MKAAILTLSLVLSANVFASADPITETSDATVAALNEFKTSADAAKFAGIKTWPVSGGVKAKIYLKNETRTVDYSCHRHHDGEPFECHDM